MFNVTKEMFIKTLERLNTNEENLTKDVEIIRNWIKTQPHLPEVMDDLLIRSFVLMNKCSIEKTKQKIDNYYSLRNSIPELFEKRNPKLPNMKKFIECTYFCVHPTPVQELYRCYFVKPKLPNTFMLPEISMYAVDLGEARMMEDVFLDVIWVVDMKNITLTDMAKVTPTLAIKILTVYEKIYAMRLKAFYFINSPAFIAKLLALLKSIMKPKIFDRVLMHEDEEIVKTLFQKEDLPKDYGGEGFSLDELQEITCKKVASYQERFDLLDELRVNEKLRPDKLDNDESLGFYGNFKKLSVD